MHVPPFSLGGEHMHLMKGFPTHVRRVLNPRSDFITAKGHVLSMRLSHVLIIKLTRVGKLNLNGLIKPNRGCICVFEVVLEVLNKRAFLD
jgi:hypothetical protein